MKPSPKNPRGFALMLVLILVALASVMGYAMLAGSSLQAVVSSNVVQAASADAMAESGVNLAMYYLQNPNNAPVGQVTSFWVGANNITFGSAVSGSCDVSVTSAGTNLYDITSTGKSSTTVAGQALTRTIKTRVQTNYTPSVDFAVGTNTSLTIPANTTINGMMDIDGTATFPAGSVPNGIVRAVAVVGAVPAGMYQSRSYTVVGPVPTSIPNYKTYVYQGATYSATQLTSDLSNITLGPTASNPAGNYWSSSSRKINSNVTINGMLIVESGLTIQGNNNVITAQPGYPALTVVNDIIVSSTSRKLTVNGLAYVGKGISKSGLTQAGSNITINGAMLLYGSTPQIISSYNGTVVINYDSTKIIVPGIGNATDAAKSITVKSWQ